jgi:hypothetical protein
MLSCNSRITPAIEINLLHAVNHCLSVKMIENYPNHMVLKFADHYRIALHKIPRVYINFSNLKIESYPWVFYVVQGILGGRVFYHGGIVLLLLFITKLARSPISRLLDYHFF